MAMEMENEGKKAMRRLAMNKAKKKGKGDAEAQPGFKPIPFLTKMKKGKK